MDTTLQDPLVGQVLDGRYRVEARIAVGGMATVYRAVDTRLDRVLALKVMHPTLAADAAFVDRFIREAKSVARLAHPNVVGVFDQGTDGTYVYLAMEYVPGCTLRDVLRERGALQPRAALDILEPMLAALGAAHLAGFVHRDMKPENVLIGDDGRVKVADFGLARAVDTATSSSTGTVLGTVSYLAPEQIEHGTADTRADVYACGVVVYEMLTGSKPHTGDTPAQILYQHLNGDIVPPSELVPGLAPELDALVASATARDPEQRPTDAVALLAQAQAARAGLGDAQLDLVPPASRAQEHDNAEDRTSVIARPIPGGGAPLPAGAGGADAPLGATTRLELPPRPAVGQGGGPRPPRTSRLGALSPRRRMLTLVAAVLLALGIGAGVWYVSYGQFTEVPSVLSLSRAEAERKLRGKGLDVVVKEEFSDAVPKGEVIASKPGVGDRIRNTGTVTITVSKGRPRTEMPNVVGIPLAEAKKKITEAGLSVGKVTRDSSTETPEGTVLATDPRPGTQRRPDTAVAITISMGAPIDVPDVVGDQVGDAEEDLRQAGFKVEIAVDKVFSEEDAGTVARQSLPGNRKAVKGDTITLTVSKGPRMVEVPDVEGENVDDAKEQLEGLGFTVEVDEPLLFAGDEVTDQSVDGGEKAPEGSTITLSVDGLL
ncbi:Stk1 family PASTA domain-containing Ser/Thr kinase [Streptomyces sp. LX-29]|uniref:Stk1 family PASTA domain-containing Ser/Thr kinase n=1 Tax=Streptomyces sp. LX-29 TaxID=2900152 RepID=UPI00240E0488|nr:Stk1 family PASTA domain-containing Ser/Thr kinase [Streptomyces sp. LX-29]WFB10006.1 Stk1 family PASTA domain-containing Ser/Thr kinase [Streptomyces sp. LX-29]